MNEDDLNLSIRKFLKKVGISSQREIENTIKSALASGKLDEHGVVNVSMTLKIDHLEPDLVIKGQVRLQE